MHNVNLLPPAVIQRFNRKRVIRAWSRLLLIAALVAMLIIAWGQTNSNAIRRTTRDHLARSRHPQEIQKQHAALSSRLRALIQYESLQLERRSRFSPLVVLSMLHQLKQDLGGQLQAHAIEFAEQMPTAGPPAPGSPSQALHGFVSLQLVANGTSACSDLMHRIRQSQLFTSVKLSSPLESFAAQSDALRFTLRCEF